MGNCLNSFQTMLASLFFNLMQHSNYARNLTFKLENEKKKKQRKRKSVIPHFNNHNDRLFLPANIIVTPTKLRQALVNIINIRISIFLATWEIGIVLHGSIIPYCVMCVHYVNKFLKIADRE